MEQMNHNLSRMSVAFKYLSWNRYHECAFEFTMAHNSDHAAREHAWMMRDAANVRCAECASRDPCYTVLHVGSTQGHRAYGSIEHARA